MTLAHPVFGTPMPDGWRDVSVDEVKAPEASSCVAGPFGSNISSKYFVAEGVPVIRGANLTDDLTQFVPSNFVFVSPERACRYGPQHVRAGDLVFTCWGTIGQVGRIPEDGPFDEYVISNKQLKLRPDPSQADSCFLFHYFACPPLVEHIRSRAVGSAVPGINLGILKSLRVGLPPLPTQRRIASVLMAYEELIESNRRRIAVLEEMAQRIYREWFLDLRYPGHGEVPVADSQLGPVPEGWRVARLADLVSTQYGYTESTSEEPVGPKFLRGMDINKASFIDWSTVPYCPIDESDYAKYRLHEGDIVVIRMADPGKVAIVEDNIEGVFASYLIRLTPKDERILPYYLFFFLGSDRYQAFVSGASTGTTRKSLSASGITGVDLLVPPTSLQQSFDDAVRPMRELLGRLLMANALLREARGLLLPRLLSGEIDVEDLDTSAEEAAA